MSSSASASHRKRAVHFIMSFLEEEGLYDTLATLQEEAKTEIEDVDTTPVRVEPFALYTALDLYENIQGSALTKDIRHEKQRISQLLQKDTATVLPVETKKLFHPSVNGVLSCCVIPSKPELLVTSTVKKDIVILDVTTGAVVAQVPLDAAGLSLSVFEENNIVYIAAGLINGDVLAFTFAGETLTPIYHTKVHAKYVVTIDFVNAQKIVSGGHDSVLAIIDLTTQEVKTFTQVGQVEKVLFNAPLDLIFVAVREDHRILCFNPKGELQDTLNMNEFGDDWISFTCMDIAINQDNLLLLATDKHRTILLDWETKKIIRNYYGCHNDGFSNPKVQWAHEGKVVVTTGQDGTVTLFNADTCKSIGVIAAHTNQIKALVITQDNTIITGSLDKTIKLFK